jgi:transcriptional regulator with XRE-family HTH domain
MARLARAIRKAMRESGESRYAIAKGAGVAASQLSRLANGTREISIGTAERIAGYLGLEITLRRKSRRKGR